MIMKNSKDSIYMPDNEMVVGDFYYDYDIRICNPNLLRFVAVSGYKDDLEKVFPVFNRLFDLSEIKWAGQGLHEFFFNVGEYTLDEYIKKLKIIYKNI